jgi:hypothetical protein
MSRVTFVFLLACSLFAQTPTNVFDKAPPEVDQALRDRISKFFQAHVDGKTRQAEQYVAEDTKDFFFDANKPHYFEFHIDKITYSDNFTKAKAIVICKQRIMMPGSLSEPLDVPTPSTWKLEDGKWYWYVDQSKGFDLPFGLHESPDAMARQSQPQARASKPPSMTSGPTIQALRNSVSADKTAVKLSRDSESSDRVTISNKLVGNVVLALDVPQALTFDVALDRTELKAGEHATLTFHSQPPQTTTVAKVEVRVTVMPINKVLPITVSIQ